MNQPKKSKNHTLKRKINDYILNKSDICCEEDLERNVVIEKIYKNYEKVADFFGEKDDYLSYVVNDIPKLIGYKIDLEKVNDKEGIRLHNKLYNSTVKNKVPKKDRITKTLSELPLYYLLAILGYSHCKLP